MASFTKLFQAVAVLVFLTFKIDAAEYDSQFEVLDQEALSVISRNVRLEVLATDLAWAEGPVWSRQLNALLFSDIARNKVLKWSEESGLEDYLYPSGHEPDGVNGAWKGANGLMISEHGELILAQQGSRTLARMTAPVHAPLPKYEILASHYNGSKLNSPNDLVQHKSGILFFTDPPYGLPKFENDPSIELPYFAVFSMSENGEKKAVITDLIKPNGIALSNDHTKLLVTDSQPSISQIYQYGLTDSGEVHSKPRLFFDASDFEKEGAGSTDGLKQHSSGIWFVTIPNGIALLSAKGKLLARLSMGQVCNLAFDDSETFVYLTAPNALLRLKLI